jgi:hypothetical protein
VLTFRITSRFVARLLVGVLLSAQMAIAAYACPVMLNGSTHSTAPSAVMGTGDVAEMQSGGMETKLVGGMDSDLPNLCLGHCQYGQQIADSTSSPSLAAVLLTSLYTLPSLEQSAGLARPIATASGPPSLADPPHAILHCCFRL